MTLVFGDGTKKSWIDRKIQLYDTMTEENVIEHTKNIGINLLSTPEEREEARKGKKK